MSMAAQAPQTGIELWMNTEDILAARARMLLVGTVSSGLFGIYITAFFLALWSSQMTADSSSKIQARIRWVAVMTAIVLLFTQIVNLAGLGDICMWIVSYQSHPVSTPGPVIHCPNVKDPVSAIVNIYIPPLIVLLSDGVLAWRVYLMSNQSPSLRYALILALIANFIMGLVVAAKQTKLAANRQIANDTFGGDNAIPYTIWAWISFGLTSALSLSILRRIKQVKIGDLSRSGLSRYATAIRAFVEAAFLSWVATLSCAFIWSSGQQQFDASTNIGPIRRPTGEDPWVESAPMHTPLPNLQMFSAIMFLALPYLLGISQVLIIARVSMSKFREMDQTVGTFAHQAVIADMITEEKYPSISGPWSHHG